jgi:cellulose binding protein with CBM2 domain
MTDPADRSRGGRRRHGRPAAAPGSGPLSFLVRYRWYAVLLACAGLAALAVATVMVVNSPDRRLVAAGCGMVSCSAALPGSATPSAAPQGTPRGRAPARPSPSHAPATATPAGPRPPARTAQPAPSRSPSSSPSPTVAPTPSGSPTPTTVAATVSYTVDQRWPGGFQGHFTIVNNGATALTGWALTATLPGDQIDSVWSASYSVDGNQLTLTAPSSQPAIAPGASQSAYFTASGSTVHPTGCVFNSQACSG